MLGLLRDMDLITGAPRTSRIGRFQGRPSPTNDRLETSLPTDESGPSLLEPDGAASTARAAHNPKVAGSNPAPATRRARIIRALRSFGTPIVGAQSNGCPTRH